MRTSYQEKAFVAATSFLVLVGILLRTTMLVYSNPEFLTPVDHHKYIYMATHNPFNFHIAPFCWRILNPLLAKLLPLNIQNSFLVLTFVQLWLSAIITYFLFKVLHFSKALSFTGLLFFLSLGWAVRINFFNFWLTDSLGFLFIVMAIWSIVVRKDVLFVVLLAVGVTARESVIFVAPLYYTLRANKVVDVRLFWRSLLFSAPAALVLLLLHVAIKPMNGVSSYLVTLPPMVQDRHLYNSLGWMFTTIGLSRMHHLTYGNLLNYSVYTFGISLMVLPFFDVKKNAVVLARFFPFVFLAFFTPYLFAYSTHRLYVAVFVPVIYMSLNGIKKIVETAYLDERLFVPLPLLLLLMLLSKRGLFLIPPLYEATVLLLYLAVVLQWGQLGTNPNRAQVERLLKE